LAEYFKNFEKQNAYSGNIQEEEKPKKFVFQIYPENIDYVDSLSYEEKHELINQLLSNYRESFYPNNRPQINTERLTKTVTAIVIFSIAIPLFLFLLNVSLDITRSNYRIFQGNFEKLFNRY
jgi:hypothetical protein